MKKLVFLDSLRGLAALYVVMIHLVYVPKPSLDIPSWLNPIIIGGLSGVYLFFMISAFSLWYTMPRHLDSAKPLHSYFISRFFRIAPLFYFFILMELIRNSGDLDLITLLKNLTFTFNLTTNSQQSIVWAGWTIGVEMLFYLSVPYLYSKIKTLKQSIYFFIITFLIEALVYAVMSYLGNAKLLYFSILRYLPIFAIGIIVYFIYRDYSNHKIWQHKYTKTIFYLALLMPIAIVLNMVQLHTFISVYLISIGYAAILILLAMRPYKLFVNRVTKFYGKISFSFYLSHPVIIFYSDPIFRKIYHVGLPNISSIIICYIYAVLATTVLAYCLFHLVESPGIYLGKKLIINAESKSPLIKTSIN